MRNNYANLIRLSGIASMPRWDVLGKHMILFGNSSHAIRYDRLLDASRPFPGFAGRNRHTGTDGSRIDCPVA
jgi:hypothetical protein